MEMWLGWFPETNSSFIGSESFVALPLLKAVHGECITHVMPDINMTFLQQ
jgi:hypothetical protein